MAGATAGRASWRVSDPTRNGGFLVPMGPYPIACYKRRQCDGAKQPFKTVGRQIIGLGETDPIEAQDSYGSSERE
jgi:hypothetical protein